MTIAVSPLILRLCMGLSLILDGALKFAIKNGSSLSLQQTQTHRVIHKGFLLLSIWMSIYIFPGSFTRLFEISIIWPRRWAQA